VVWLLGFSPNHNYDLFVERASRKGSVGSGGINALMPSFDDYGDLDDSRNEDWQLDRVVEAWVLAVAHVVDMPDTACATVLADVVRAHLFVTGDSRTLHVCFEMPPLAKGVLPSGFEWILVGTVEDLVDANSIRYEDFPIPGLCRGGGLVVDLSD
jgi:hypothetical protein